MNFLKKNIFYLILTAFMIAVFAIPKFGDFVRGQILMSPSISKVESEITFSDSDYNIALKGINVPDANLKDFKNETVFLNFWGTWCPPCRAEWPTIQKLYDAKNGKMKFVLIAMQDKEEDIRKFLKENNYNVPVYVAQSPLTEKLLPSVFPTTYILAKGGRILQKEDGSKDWNSKNVLDFIDNVTK
ncbi:Thiol-disulfide isomerase or thioredoxin [Halpernia humi]|uniref:Thiol-disulfide isomerase or thioredoxin n=1 Tax=Halpernia humi TaxID=493375 RepID=A0A1H5SQG1_9FLAO|nr:TlpA disulfide reductase family protein [Halpernia humi]SEF52836.1 Thiol-disulfide isomerase or thioredoxin [Halpernia humi]